MGFCSIRILPILLFAVVTAEACQVPVFRYALERWRPDPYQLVIVHEGNLTSGQKSKLVHLEESLVGSNGPIVNLRIETIDLTKEKDQPERWQKIHRESNASVTMHLFYPFQGFEPGALPIWNGAFTKKNIETVLDSPARRELVKRILAGNSAVWLFLESGNKEEDDKLFKELENHARLAEKEIAIPKGVIQQSALDDPDLLLGPEDEENILESSVPLKIAFSIHRLSRKDPEEPSCGPCFSILKMTSLTINLPINPCSFRCSERDASCHPSSVKESTRRMHWVTAVISVVLVPAR